jgi:hypothetical protein
MLVKNKTNGKKISISEKDWDKISAKSKSNFIILVEKKEDKIVQIVENKATPTPLPDSGTKPGVEKKKK